MTGMDSELLPAVGLLGALAGLSIVIRRIVINSVTRSSKTGLLGESAPIPVLVAMSETSSDSTSTPRGWVFSSTWKIRRRGAARVLSAAMIGLTALALIALPLSVAMAKYFSRYPTYEIGDKSNLVQVVQFDETSQKYEFRYKSLNFWMKLCEKPPFDPGDYLELYKWEDRGSCASLQGEWTAVLMRRNEHGKTDSEVAHERQR